MHGCTIEQEKKWHFVPCIEIHKYRYIQNLKFLNVMYFNSVIFLKLNQ